MRRMTGHHVRAGTPPSPRGAQRGSTATARDALGRAAAGGGAGLVFLSILFWMIFYQNLPDNLDGMASGGGETSNQVDRVIKVLMILVSSYTIASRWAVTRSVVKSINVGSVLVLGIAILSAAWSFSPSATMLRFVSLLNIFLVCFAICIAGYHQRRFQQVALPPLFFILLGSLAVGVIYPDRIMEIGTDLSQKNAWHGITHGKNEFGMVASIAAIICTNLVLARSARPPLWAMAGTAVAFTCLLLSRSNTSLLSTMLAVMLMFLVMRVPIIRERYSTHVALTLTIGILLYELAIQDIVPGTHTLISPVMHLTGKDATFSGRTIIWDIVKAHSRYSPLLGTGYGAYWLGTTPDSPSYVFVPVMYFYPSEAHNGYLDIVNDLGWVGLTCLLVFIFWYVRQALQLMRVDRSQGALYIGLLLQQMVMNMSESEWFARTSTFAVLILASICLSRGVADMRARYGTR